MTPYTNENAVTRRLNSMLGRRGIIAVLLAAVCSCSTVPPKNQVKKPTDNQPKVAEQQIYSSADYLNMAKQKGDSPTYLLMAAEAALKEQQFEKCLIITASINQISVPLEIKQQLVLVEAASHMALGNFNDAERVLTTDIARTAEIRFEVYRLRAQLYGSQKRYVESLRNWFEVEKAIEAGQLDGSQADLAKTIWYQLNQLPDIALDTFAYNEYTNAKAWIQLMRITRLYTGQPSKLQSQLKLWYQQHPNHVAMDVLPKNFQRSLTIEPYDPEKVVVLLPFNGKLRKQALAIRNGLLLASQGKEQLTMVFIDSELPIAEVEQQILLEQPQFVIGPLLKENVEAMAQSPVLENIPSLFLNRISLPSEPNPDHFYFGLAPEDEVEQAATTLFKLGFKKPAVIAPENSLGARLSEAFSSTWLAQPSDGTVMKPEVDFYVDQAQMQDVVKGLMDVDLSRQRIKHIASLINTELETESRNRQDLDVIYLIGNNIQTRLLKPFIDVNVSPFTTPMPVYASSRSHEVKSERDKRDLRMLTFTEIPWLLDSETRYDKQRKLFEQLWPAEDASQRRLFALGYDALYLLDRIAQLRVLNGLTERCMSGLISVDENGLIVRRHLWAQYDSKGEIEPVNLN